jgi:hypothetical protein
MQQNATRSRPYPAGKITRTHQGDAMSENAETPEPELTAATAAKAERDSLLRRFAAAERAFAAAQAVVDETSRSLTAESADVARLETMSVTRLLAALRGSRATRLEAERAEQTRAEYAHAVAVATRDEAAARRRSLRQALDATAGVEGRYQAALQAKEDWLTADPHDGRGRELLETAQRRGRLIGLQVETEQAIAAGQQALECLTEARAELSSAKNWADLDVFAGGGLLVDSVKRDRMDRAARRLHAAEVAMRRFSTELADVGASVDALDLDLTMSVLDTVFDNIFTDLAVKNRITDSSRQAQRAHQGVAEKVTALKAELRAVTAQRQALDERRTALLTS